MNRVLFVAMEEDRVISRCKAEDVGISVLEKLPLAGFAWSATVATVRS